jgi:hypothetical protein
MGEHETVAKAASASAAAWRSFMACILSSIHLSRRTFRSRPLDQPPGMNGANVQVAHRPPDSVNRPNVCRSRKIHHQRPLRENFPLTRSPQ